jgi:hypothetical protein
MDFDLIEEKRIIQKTISDFATKELAPSRMSWMRRRSFQIRSSGATDP